MDDFEAIGRALAARHVEQAEPDPDGVLANYAERSRAGDWSMRAALTRFSLPQPVRSSEILRLVRRLDAALHPFARALEGHTVTCDRALTPASVVDPPVQSYSDTRTADLARLSRAEPAGFEVVLNAYLTASGLPLDDAEQAALPLLGVAVHLDSLAETLTEWANRGPQNPPIDAVDETCAIVGALLDELGVPEEQGPPPGRSGRRDRGV